MIFLSFNHSIFLFLIFPISYGLRLSIFPLIYGLFLNFQNKCNDNSQRALSTHAHSAYSAHGVSSGGSVDGGGAAAATATVAAAARAAIVAASLSGESRRCLPPCRHCRRRCTISRKIRQKLPPSLPPPCCQSPVAGGVSHGATSFTPRVMADLPPPAPS
jgi:hypothetical protein